MRLIFIHGFGCAARDWEAQSSELGQRFEAVTLDLAAPSSASRRGHSLIREMAETVNQARGRSTTGVVLIGHSMGCRIALEAKRLDPLGIAGLVLIEGSLRAVGDADEAVRSYLSRAPRENKRRLEEDFAGMFSDATPPAFRDMVLRRIEGMDADDAVRLMADMTRWDAAEAGKALRSAQVPTLIVQSTHKEPGGRRRAIVPQDASPWLCLVEEHGGREVEIVHLEGLGHFPHVEAPDAVNDLIVSFVSRLSGRAAPSAAAKPVGSD